MQTPSVVSGPDDGVLIMSSSNHYTSGLLRLLGKLSEPVRLKRKVTVCCLVIVFSVELMICKV